MELLKSISYGKRFWIYWLVGLIFSSLVVLIPIGEGEEFSSTELLIIPFGIVFLYCFVKAGRNWFFWENPRRSGLWQGVAPIITIIILALYLSPLVIGYFLGWMSQEPNCDELFCELEESK
ncbi:MAG TPA: hypothetical protein VMX17_06030 [Candidatus Glassbacteria bacterium]|nr:hypothetical protein [Candidatus Glassbacteria bacterium]